MKKDKNEISLWEESELKICRYCAYAKRLPATEEVLCEKKNVIHSEDNICKKYKYDILKKELRRRKSETKKFDKDDFAI